MAHKKTIIIASALAGSLVAVVSFAVFMYRHSASGLTRVDTEPVTHFSDSLFSDARLEEAGSISDSAHDRLWVSSGAWLVSSNGVWKTAQGDLSASDLWRKKYRNSNPNDTDDGLHPQNIFRLIETDLWGDFVQHAYFKINAVNASESLNRDASNGFFFFNRYQTGDNLYYTGIRVDGSAVIKKKMGGEYETMAQKAIFFESEYDRSANPNVVPEGEWIGLKSEMATNPDKTVTIRLYTDIGKTGEWMLTLIAHDNGTQFGPAILAPGHVGIRTDFMDAEFYGYRIDAL